MVFFTFMILPHPVCSVRLPVLLTEVWFVQTSSDFSVLVLFFAADSRQVDLGVNVQEIPSQQVADRRTQDGCCVENPCGEKEIRV